jgi:hypothetical protein
MRGAFQNNFGWLLTALVLSVVLGAGARLIYLGGQHHEAAARERAAALAASSQISRSARQWLPSAARRARLLLRSLVLPSQV